MPLQKVQLRPGIVRDTTNYSNEGGWYECDKVRFFSGYPQKIGGWVKSSPQTFLGTCRQLWNWITSFTDNLLAVGTNRKVYIEAGTVFYDITPIRDTLVFPATNNCIETTNGSNVVTVNVSGHGCETGAFVTISGVAGTGGNVGGIPDAELNGEHEVTRVDADIFTFVVATAATSTDAGGGGPGISIACQINPGFASATEGYGWGTGGWGISGWGLSSAQPVFLPQRDWFFDNFDNDLVMNIRVETNPSGKATGGPIYYWERGPLVNPTNALGTRAVLLSGLTLNGVTPKAVPATAMQIMVSQNDKHLLAFGCQPYQDPSLPPDPDEFDPLLIRWASQDQPNDWQPRLNNSAGFLRVSRGSKIVRAVPTRQETIVLTDTHVYSFQFLGTTDVFGLQELADNVSVIGPRATVTANNVLYWMGTDKFYAYDGRVQTLPCSIREYIFKDINFDQSDQIVCGTNEGFTEVWWFYPSADSNWINRYAIYNHLNGIWYYGNLVRTAWLDVSSRDFPIAAYTPEGSNTGILYTHEVGINDDDLPMSCFIQSSDFDVGDGEQFMLTKRIIPDVNFDKSTAPNPEVTFGIRSRNFPGSAYANNALNAKPVIETSVDIYTEQVFIRTRGRQMAMRISSDGLGVQWQLGSPRIEARTDGKR